MSEITFAKAFLATLDKRQIKLSPDHVSDPRKYPNQSPYTLPRATHPYPRRTGPTSTQRAQTQTLTVSLKPMRAGETITLSDITLDTSIHDLKTQYAAKAGGLQQDKIKLLYNKKPAADLKTLNDLGVEGGDVELSVMLMAGATGSTPRAQSPAVSAPVTGDKMDVDTTEANSAPESEKAAAEAEVQHPGGGAGDSATETLKSEEFWDDLKGFLTQRLRDEGEAERLAKVFRGSLK